MVGRSGTWDELKAICLFHALGFSARGPGTSSGASSRGAIPTSLTPAVRRPVVLGFMCTRRSELHHPGVAPVRSAHPPSSTVLMAAGAARGVFSPTPFHRRLSLVHRGLRSTSTLVRTVVFRPFDRDRTMPLLLAFVPIGFFIWLGENAATFLGIWRYPNQLGAWTLVHVAKWSSWSLLVIATGRRPDDQLGHRQRWRGDRRRLYAGAQFHRRHAERQREHGDGGRQPGAQHRQRQRQNQAMTVGSASRPPTVPPLGARPVACSTARWSRPAWGSRQDYQGFNGG